MLQLTVSRSKICRNLSALENSARHDASSARAARRLYFWESKRCSCVSCKVSKQSRVTLLWVNPRLVYARCCRLCFMGLSWNALIVEIAVVSALLSFATLICAFGHAGRSIWQLQPTDMAWEFWEYAHHPALFFIKNSVKIAFANLTFLAMTSRIEFMGSVADTNFPIS